MITTVTITFLLFLATLISTSFHWVNLGVLGLLFITVFYKKNIFYLVLSEALFLAVFGHVNLGLSLVMLGILVYLANFTQETFLPNHLGASLVMSLVLFVVWDIVFSMLI